MGVHGLTVTHHQQLHERTPSIRVSVRPAEI